MRDTYIPLFASTLMSSLWSMSGDCLKVFFTLALQADPEGMVVASVDGVARVCALPVQQVIEHIERLAAPDPYSKDRTRSPTADGRRIEQVPNGYRVLNLEWYREEARRQAELSRKRRWWQDKGSAARRGARPTETETETETISSEGDVPPTPAASRFPAPTVEELEATTKAEPHYAKKAPADFEPDDSHRVRCQELKLDLSTTLRSFKVQEFNRKYSDWPLRFSKWIEDERIKRETAAAKERAAPSPSASLGRFARGAQALEPSAEAKRYAASHGLDLGRILAALALEGAVEALGPKGAQDELRKRLQAERKRKRPPEASP